MGGIKNRIVDIVIFDIFLDIINWTVSVRIALRKS